MAIKWHCVDDYMWKYSKKMPISIQNGTATPVESHLLKKGQEVEGINVIESTRSMSGREG